MRFRAVGTVLRLSSMLCVMTTVFVGVAFPLIVTGIARVLFADAIDLSRIDVDRSLMAATTADVAAGVSDDDAAKGAALFAANCSACHQASGEGLPGAFPSLRGNDTVNRPDPTAQILVVLYGLQGVRVGGVVYPTAMPAFGVTLSDADVAGLINHERNAWGNHGAPVIAAMVNEQRAHGKMIR